MRRSFAGVAAVVAALTAHAAGGTAVGAESVACDVAAIQAKAPPGTTITAAAMVEAAEGRPRYCQVDGHAASAGNTVNFQLGLPESWNGKFLFLGVGGLGGSLAKLDPGLARGYATATTDTGHRCQRARLGEQPREGDRLRLSGHARQHRGDQGADRRFYGAPPRYAYFEGCSNGGRQALMEVQRYPDDFDGVIGGRPRDRHTHAGWPGGRVSADAGVARRAT